MPSTDDYWPPITKPQSGDYWLDVINTPFHGKYYVSQAIKEGANSLRHGPVPVGYFSVTGCDDTYVKYIFTALELRAFYAQYLANRKR